MAWGRLDDGIIDHPKFAALAVYDGLKPVERLAAVGLWCKAIGYCSKHLTDGFIPRGVVPLLAGTPPALAFRLADALVAIRGRTDHGLWDSVEDGYQFHDWSEWNPTKQDVADLRQRRQEAGRQGGRRSGEARAKAKREAKSQASAQASAVAKPEAKPNPIPSHPSNTPQPPEALASQGTNGTNGQQPTTSSEPPDGYRVHDGMFNLTGCPPNWTRGTCVKTEYRDAVPFFRQCPEHKAQATA